MVKLTDVRCPTPLCGRKLADEVNISSGYVKLTCSRCKKVIVLGDRPPGK